MKPYELATNKTVLLSIMAGLFLFGLWCELRTPVKINERIYLAAAVYLDDGCNLNPEHPMLAKELQSLVLTEEYKQVMQKIYQINCSEFYINDYPNYARFKELYYKLFDPPSTLSNGFYPTNEWQEAKGIYYLRMITGLILFFTIVLFFKEPTTAFIVFNLFYLTKLFYIAELDGFLTLLTIIAAYSLVKKNNYFGSIIAYAIIPLIKFNGFILSFILFLIDPVKNPIKLLAILLSWLLFFNLDLVWYAMQFYSNQITRFDTFFQYQYPIYFALLLAWFILVGGRHENRNS